MELERDQESQTYRLCQIAFALLSLALVIACFSSIITLPRHFGGRSLLPWLIHSPIWPWIDTPIVWASLCGSYLLWARWDEPGWQRRTGLLMVMCLADAVLWSLDHAASLGLRDHEVGHFWLRGNVGQALGWAEFTLLASLSSDVLVHLGVDQAAETGKATRSLAATGAVVWLLLFLIRTDWKRGWPLEFRRFFSLETLILELGATMISTIVLIQVMMLVIAAMKQCTTVLFEIAREEEASDQFASRSEGGMGLLARHGKAWGED